MQAPKPFQPLSPMFAQNPANDAVGAMRPVNTDFADHGAAAAANQNVASPEAAPLPLTKDTISSRGRAFAWRQVSGQIGTFMNTNEDSAPPVPSSYGSGA